MKLGLLLSVSLAACATSATSMESREPAPRANVSLDFSAAGDADRAVFPAAIEPRLPSVDRIAHHVRARLGDQAVASLELCVAPDGHVTKVALLEGTSYGPFDVAVVRDVHTWQFAPMPGHSAVKSLQTCERATVKYLAPR